MRFNVGDQVTTTVYGINDRSEEVTGTVVEIWRGKMYKVQTDTHGTLMVSPSKAR